MEAALPRPSPAMRRISLICLRGHFLAHTWGVTCTAAIAPLWLRMSDSASQVVVESATKDQMTTMLQELLAQNAEMKKALAAKAPARDPCAEANAHPVKAIQKELEAQITQQQAQEQKQEHGGDKEDENEDEDGEDDEDDAEEEEEEETDKASTITPAPKAKAPPAITPSPSATPAPPADNDDLGQFADAKSTTHRKEWMAFGRRMDCEDAPRKFPQLFQIWDSSKEDPQNSVFVSIYRNIIPVQTCASQHNP